MAKSSPVKVSVECPHCGFKQQDYAAAKSTMCRQCGSHFSPGAARRPAVVMRKSADAPPPSAAPVAKAHHTLPDFGGSASALLKQFDGLWKGRGPRTIECFDCHRKQEVSGQASSTICPQCSAHIDLQNYKIASSFSRTIRTTGEVHVTNKADLNSTNVHCTSALVQGKMRGNLHCLAEAKFDLIGRIAGRISAPEIIIEKRAEVQFFRRVRAQNVEVRGQMTGEIVAQGMVTIRKHGSLEGNVTARAINVEKGGLFSGQLIIGQADLKQAELLPRETPARDVAAEAGGPIGEPVPAT